MTYQCSACKRSFAEPGFCPMDGTQLAELPAEAKAAPDAPTLLSEEVRAQSHADTAPHEKVEPPAGAPVAGPNDKTSLKSFSAAHTGGERDDAMASIRRRVSEYDRLIGETLDGRYYVQRKIGEGGMGVVFAVKHTVIERPLAIKVLKKNVMRDQGTVKRFIQEARAASRIGHPNIVDVTDFGNTADGMTYQVMELIDGVTLSKVIKTAAPLPFERVQRVGTQIARALVAAHAKGIVHRDLKPENVFLTEREGRPDFVKIVDFGIAKVTPVEGTAEVAGPRLTRQGSVFGTPEYMAPEQAAGRGDTDHRVDIYALGTILYEMLVGRVPHKGDSMIRTVAMQMLDPITPPSKVNPDLGIPPDLEAVVMKALAKKREDRYATMAAMLTALESISFESPTMPEVAPPTMTPADGSSHAETGPRRAKPPTRPLHEPQFVAAPGTPVSFSHVYDESPPDMEQPPSRWPMIAAGLIMLALGAGGTIYLLSRLGSDNKQVVTAQRLDAAVIAELHDAGSVEPPVDALAVVDMPVDAGAVVTSRPPPRDAGVAGVVGRPPIDKKGNVTIEVLTRPGDANVFIRGNYRGPSGVRISEKYGAKLKVECKTDRMKGSVEVVFDGNLTAIMCTAARDRFCVPGLKNPYDDCEEDPNATP